MTGNSRRAITANPPISILLYSIRVLKNCIVTLAYNLRAPSAYMRYLLKLFLGL
jgi:hypothetical protein